MGKMYVDYLKERDTLGRFSATIYKSDNFLTSCLLSYTPLPLEKS